MANRVPVVVVNGEMRQLPTGDTLGDSNGLTLKTLPIVINETSTGSITITITNNSSAGQSGWVINNDSLATLYLATKGTTSTPVGLLLANSAFFQCNLESVFVFGCSSAFDFSIDGGATRKMRLKNGLRVGTGSGDPGTGNLTVEGVITAGSAPTTLTNSTGQLLFAAHDEETLSRLNLAILQ